MDRASKREILLLGLGTIIAELPFIVIAILAILTH
jgi:hypothetical protein